MRTPQPALAALVVLWLLLSVGAINAQPAYWESVNIALTSRILCLASSPRGPIFAGTEDQKVLRSTNGGSTWIEVGDVQLSRAIWSLAVDSVGTVFAGTDFRGLYRSTDDGATWLPSSLTTQRIACLLVTRQGVLFAGAWDEGIYRSTDGGIGWSLVGAPAHKIRSFLETSDGTIFAGTDTIHQEGRLYRSTDAGQSWTRIGAGLAAGVVYSLVSVSAETLFAGTSGQGIYVSTNTGDTWTPSYPLLPTTVNALVYLPEAGIFSGLESAGVFRTTNGGASWFIENTGLLNVEVHCFMAGLDGRLYAGTGGGVYRSTRVLTAVTSDEEQHGTAGLSLSAHPNPFNAEIVLRYNLPYSGPAQLSAYDLMGRRIPILEAAVHNAGSGSVRWVANNLASGVYFVVLESLGRRLSCMVLLLK